MQGRTESGGCLALVTRQTMLLTSQCLCASQRIRCHEACIVVSDTEDKAYKFVVLTDDWLYLTENPPKRVHPVVHLGDVLSVELVSWFQGPTRKGRGKDNAGIGAGLFQLKTVKFHKQSFFLWSFPRASAPDASHPELSCRSHCRVDSLNRITHILTSKLVF